jgi:MYXO-CTERM domain-containing protein
MVVREVFVRAASLCPGFVARVGRGRLRASFALCIACVGTFALPAHAVTGPFAWKGYTWNPTTGGMAGVCPGDPANISVDATGYLHLKITKNGSTWTASEVFTNVNLGFGTYQWQIAGPIDRMDHTVVLGLFPYGPQVGIGRDGTNEIDTEFSFWNDEVPGVNADWGVYPPSAAGTHWEDDFLFSLHGGAAATTRMVWSASGITGTLMGGFQPLGTTANVLATTSYMPSNATSEIPQQALPLGMNLWCYKAAPSSGQNVEIVIQDFQFVPQGADAGAGAGDSGSGGDAATGGEAGADAAAVPEAGESDSGALAADAAPTDSSGSSAEDAGALDAGADGVPSGEAASTSGASGCGCVAAGEQGGGPKAPPVFGALGALTVLAARRRRRAARR